MTSENHDWVLASNPEMATSLARVITGYASLDLMMFVVYAMLSQKPVDDCFSDYFSLRAINKRKELVDQAAEAIPLDPIRMTALKRIWRRMKGAAARRTEVAHVQFMKDGKGYTRLHLYGDRAKYVPVDLKFFERTINQYRTLQKDIAQFVVFLGPLRGVEGTIARISELPLPPNAPPLPKRATPAPLTPHEIAEQNASIGRLGLGCFLRPSAEPIRMKLDPSKSYVTFPKS